jgi:hypothetical protein
LVGGATDKTINAEARQWFIATVEKDELLGVASSDKWLEHGLVQHIFNPPSRRCPSYALPVHFHCDAGLKTLALCKSLHKRRNWIHIGREQAGPRVAAIISVIETCRRLKIPIREYLCSIFPGLASFPINRIAEPTPLLGWLTTKRQRTSNCRLALTVC